MRALTIGLALLTLLVACGEATDDDTGLDIGAGDCPFVLEITNNTDGFVCWGNPEVDPASCCPDNFTWIGVRDGAVLCMGAF